MFKCGICGEQQQAGVGARTIVLKTRDRVYLGGKDGKKEIGRGSEIVLERKACSPCGQAHDYAKAAASGKQS